ncbi:MAG: hypothetical protein Q9166_007748 [cf. Caloplaca sp. 2 TL-2023]
MALDVSGRREMIALLVQELRSSLQHSQVLTPESEGYAESIKRWSDAVEMRAGIVVYVGSADDISTTITLSRKYLVPFVVSGGRHSSSGASSTLGGLVIDLAKMRRVLVNVPTKTVRAQGGCIWEDIDNAAADHSLAMVGGTVNHTGVGGLTLGGGYGWLSGRYGLTIDSLLAVQIVLADGSIKAASAEENADLFWAVRGAGHCFGVVAEFTFQAHEQKDPIWAGQLVFLASKQLDGVIAFANDLVSNNDGNSGMLMGITAPPFMSELAVVTTLFHNGNSSEAEVVFKGLLDLQPLRNTTQERPYREMNSIMNHLVPSGGRRLSKGASFVPPLSPDFVRSLIGELQELHSRVRGSPRTILLFEFFKPDAWCQVPEEATAFASRGRQQNLMIGPLWNKAEDDMICRDWARTLAGMAKSELERVKDKAGRPQWMERIGEYGNYDGELLLLTCNQMSGSSIAPLGLLSDARGIYGHNYERLRELKDKYDAANVFNKSHAIVPSDGGKRESDGENSTQ